MNVTVHVYLIDQHVLKFSLKTKYTISSNYHCSNLLCKLGYIYTYYVYTDIAILTYYALNSGGG